MKKKLARITTVSASLGTLIKGQLRFMSAYYEVIGIPSTGEDRRLKRVVEDERTRVAPVEMTRRITPFRDLIAAWKLSRIFRKERPFIVHTHTSKEGTLGMLAAYLAGLPHRLHTIAELPLMEVQDKKRWVLDQVEKLTYNCATQVYPDSIGLKDIVFKKNYTSLEKLTVIENGSSNGIDKFIDLYHETMKRVDTEEFYFFDDEYLIKY